MSNHTNRFHCVYIQYTCLYIKWFSSRNINSIFDVLNKCLTTPTAFTAYIYSIHVYISNGVVPETINCIFEV